MNTAFIGESELFIRWWVSPGSAVIKSPGSHLYTLPSIDMSSLPSKTRKLLWEEYRKEEPRGYGYTQFCEHLSRYSYNFV